MPRGLYIHVPFCISKCGYCDFTSMVFDKALAERYLGALCAEMARRAAGRVETVFIGGGTPTVLGTGGLGRIMASVREHFGLAPGAEVTVEANPSTLGSAEGDVLLNLSALGVNRLSLGVQSLDAGELKTLGRAHGVDEALDALGAIDIDNFSVDLMYGIPSQSTASWARTLGRVLEFNPAHVSAYELTPESGTSYMRALEAGELMAPDEEEVLEMFNHTIETLEAAGLKQYEISNFARDGMHCRHNLNYWRRGEYLGLGPGAHSFVNAVRESNAPDVSEYVRLIESGTGAVVESRAIGPLEARREAVMLGLRTRRGIDVSEIDGLAEAAGELIREGFVELAGGCLRLTRKGMRVASPVTVRLFEALGL